MLNPPATAESIENPATETIKKRFFPATKETIKKPTTETITKNDSCDDGNHKNQRRKPFNKNRWMMSTTETVKRKRPDGFRDKLR